MRSVQTPIIPVVQALIGANPGTISLGQGVVNYPPPNQVLEVTRAFVDNQDLHKYQYVEGIPALKEGIARKLAAENGIDLSGRGIVVTAGSNMGFLNTVLAIADPGDEIILLKPYFFNHEMAITMLGCRAITVDMNSDNQPVIEAIAAAITNKTRAVVTVSPNNPSGAVYGKDALQAIGDLCSRHGLYHVSDEAYEYFVYDGVPHHAPCSFEGTGGNTIGLYSFSKGYGFASWRIGYMVVPEALTEPIRKIQDTNLICPPVVSQLAAVAALEAGRQYCEPHIEALAQVRDAVLEELQTLGERIRIPAAEGAFYFLINVDTTRSSMALVRGLIEEYGVAVIPGSTFGISDDTCTVRIAYGALDKDTVMDAVSRLVRGLDRLTRE